MYRTKESVQEKLEILRDTISTILVKEIREIGKLQNAIKKINIEDKATHNLVDLISICSVTTGLQSTYENSSENLFMRNIGNIKKLISDNNAPQNKDEFDLYVSEQLDKKKTYKKIINELCTYDYKTLKIIYNQYKDLGVEK